MSKKIKREFPLRCRKCGKSVGKNFLIPARANKRTIEAILLLLTSSLCEDCKKLSISTITDPVTGMGENL